MKTEVKLSRRHAGIVDCIRKSVTEHGYPPSIREIGLAVGLTSPSTVHTHLKTLENKGILKRNPSKPRSIELLDAKSSSPVVLYHKSLVDFVRSLHDDLAPVAEAPPNIHQFNTPEQAAIAKIKAVATVAAYKKILDRLMATSPLGGLQ